MLASHSPRRNDDFRLLLCEASVFTRSEVRILRFSHVGERGCERVRTKVNNNVLAEEKTTRQGPHVGRDPRAWIPRLSWASPRIHVLVKHMLAPSTIIGTRHTTEQDALLVSIRGVFDTQT